jgi:hypothetical protein
MAPGKPPIDHGQRRQSSVRRIRSSLPEIFSLPSNLIACAPAGAIGKCRPHPEECAKSMPRPSSAVSAGAQPPRLLDQLRAAASRRFGRPEPADSHADWARRYIVFHGNRHPRDPGADDVGRFLQYFAHSEKDPLRCVAKLARMVEELHSNEEGVRQDYLPLLSCLRRL